MAERRGDLDVPPVGWFLLLDGGLAVLALLAGSPRAYRRARAAAPLPPRPALAALLVGSVGVHLAEAAWAVALARRKGLRPGPWAVQTAVVGFPSLLRLRRRGP